MGKLKSAEELGITEQQRINLAKLAIFVKNHVCDEAFTMGVFNTKDGFYANQASYKCGTQSCLCGYGPLAGIEPQEYERWDDYASRCFDNHIPGIWGFLFASMHFDDREMAVLRVAYLLTHGTDFIGDRDPDEMEAPEDFLPDWQAIKELSEKQCQN